MLILTVNSCRSLMEAPVKSSVSIALLLLFFSAVPGSMSLSQVDTLTILHLNDTHSTLAPIGPRTAALEGTLGGIARAATIIGRVKAKNPGVPAVVLHAGDFSIGDIFYNVTFGVAELRILAALGVDAIAVGNHEFDLGPSTLLRVLDSAFVGNRIPLLSSNLVLADPSVRGLRTYIQPSVVRTIGSRKIGIFGLTTPATNLLSQPLPAVVDTNVVPIAAATIKTLRSEGCVAVICLSHLGIAHDRLLARAVTGIDLIVGGHDHYLTKRPEAVVNPGGDTTWIVQSNAFYLDMGMIRFSVAPGGVRFIDYKLIPLDASVRPDPSVEQWSISSNRRSRRSMARSSRARLQRLPDISGRSQIP
jgi:5'-nucleotidase